MTAFESQAVSTKQGDSSICVCAAPLLPWLPPKATEVKRLLYILQIFENFIPWGVKQSPQMCVICDSDTFIQGVTMHAMQCEQQQVLWHYMEVDSS